MIDTTKFDISSLQITDTSHSCVTKITNPNKVEFIFENINLPFDDATNDGYVAVSYTHLDVYKRQISGSLISNASGNYSIPVSVGTHTITPQFENPTYFTSSPTSTTVGFPATASPFIQDFCIVPNGVHHDLEVVILSLIHI